MSNGRERMTDDRQPPYPEAILAHARRPIGSVLPHGADPIAERDNPLCGDRVRLGLVLDDGRIAELGFEGRGCALSIASASMLVAALHGKPVAEAHALGERYRALVAARAESWPEALGELSAFAAIARFPARRDCVCLAWEALRDALGSERGD